jgi:hypothetical protein
MRRTKDFFKRSSFPKKNYTPYGYLYNRFDTGPFFGLDYGGPLRSMPGCGYGWMTTIGQAGFRVGAIIDGELIISPEHFKARKISISSRYHTKNIQSFDWEYEGIKFSFAFFLADHDTICCRVAVSETVPIVAVVTVPRMKGKWDGTYSFNRDAGTLSIYLDPGPWYSLASTMRADRGYFLGDRDDEDFLDDQPVEGSFGISRAKGYKKVGASVIWIPEGDGDHWIALSRGVTRGESIECANLAISRAEEVLSSLVEDDDMFWSSAPMIEGDWPPSWIHSWVYDMETTRMMICPPAGMFNGPWPSWMGYLQRVVLAEGTLDMMRLSYADPILAKEAVLTMFRDSPAPNIPCIWANGGYNMVAEDGTPCGTSPAWCLPFHNIYVMYLRHLDKIWLSHLYPFMEDYLIWWLENRRDEDGYLVYKCSWESGEDCSPRLDPERKGYGDLMDVTRPVELQAAMAQSSRILELLGREIGIAEERLDFWKKVYKRYSEMTRAMWDEKEGRFKDIPKRMGEWVEAEHDPLQLIPLMYDVATEDQKRILAAKLDDFNSPPWILWPSWTYIITEVARAVGRYDLASEISYGVIRRVYAENDRRSYDWKKGPIPGVAREYWPLSLEEWDGSECYGWGATTLTLLIRNIIGFIEKQETDSASFILVPSISKAMAIPGKRYGLVNLSYRGMRIDIVYEILEPKYLLARLKLEGGEISRILGPDGEEVPIERGEWVCFKAENFRPYEVRTL